MNNGDIVEVGNHDELMQKQGFYYNLYSSQFDNEDTQKKQKKIKKLKGK